LFVGTQLIQTVNVNLLDYGTVTLTVPMDLLSWGDNAIGLVLDAGIVTQIGVAMGPNVPLTASYYWQEIAGQTEDAHSTNTLTESITTGVSRTHSSVDSFCESIGLDVSMQAGGLFGKVSWAVTSSFSATEAWSHAVTISDTESVNRAVQVAPSTQTYYQYWQLVMRYELSDGAQQPYLDQQTPVALLLQYPKSA
jgi:hypothetical protein